MSLLISTEDVDVKRQTTALTGKKKYLGFGYKKLKTLEFVKKTLVYIFCLSYPCIIYKNRRSDIRNLFVHPLVNTSDKVTTVLSHTVKATHNSRNNVCTQRNHEPRCTR